MPRRESHPSLKKQLALREARAATSFVQAGAGLSRLLIAVPLAWTEAGTLSDWRAIQQEAEQSYRNLWEPEGLAFRLSAVPCACDLVTKLSQKLDLGVWVERIQNTGSFEVLASDRASDQPGPYVWLGVVEAAADNLATMESRFFKVAVGAGRTMAPVNLRMEALLEAQGLKARVFPPTAFWNALSLSRILFARLKLQELTQSGMRWTARRQGASVVVTVRGQECLRLNFPEETNADLEPLFRANGGL